MAESGRPIYARGFGLVLLAGLLLSGCAETNLLTNTAKRAAGSADQTSDGDTLPTGPGRGIYKVGDPYQISGVWYYPAEDWDYNETGIASWYGPGFHAKYTANGEIFNQNELTAAHRTLPMPSFVRVTNLDNGRAIVVRVNDRGPFARGRIIDMSRRAAQLLGFEQNGTAKVRVQILTSESREIATLLRAQNAPGPRLAKAQSLPSPLPAGPPKVDVLPGEPPARAAPRPIVTAQALPGVAVAEPQPVAAVSLPDPTRAPPTQVAPRTTQIFVQAGAFANADNATRLSGRLGQFGQTAITPVKIGTQTLFRVRVGPLASVDLGDRMLDQIVAAGFPEARLIVD